MFKFGNSGFSEIGKKVSKPKFRCRNREKHRTCFFVDTILCFAFSYYVPTFSRLFPYASLTIMENRRKTISVRNPRSQCKNSKKHRHWFMIDTTLFLLCVAIVSRFFFKMRNAREKCVNMGFRSEILGLHITSSKKH